jgi:arylsulfatase A
MPSLLEDGAIVHSQAQPNNEGHLTFSTFFRNMIALKMPLVAHDKEQGMQRRHFLKATGIVTAGLLLDRPGLLAESAERPPNLIMIMADDLGAKELGCYGNREHRTPNLDRLAQTGVQFRTCYATPICHPTRFEIMTGQYGHHNGVYQFPGRRGGPVAGSPEDNIARHLTFAQVLKTRGYATAHAGKWQLTGKVPTLVKECGFDEYCMWAYKQNLPPGVVHTGGWEGKRGGKTSRYWHPSIMKNGKYVPTKPDDYGPDIFTDFVIDFIKRHRDGPFFVYHAMCLTHGPFYVTPDTVKSEDEKFRNARNKNFKANVEYVDKLVGRIVKALEAAGLRKNTVVLFTGDNGTGGQGKGQPTELGARVPMIANGPGIVKSSIVSDELVDFSDILPTLADFARAKLPEGHVIDGRSFAPLLRGEKGPTREWIYSYLGDRQILRTKRWLLEDNGPNHPGHFFDCGDSRDGTGYKDVTNSTTPEVIAAKRRFKEILADKPLPIVSKTKG